MTYRFDARRTVLLLLIAASWPFSAAADEQGRLFRELRKFAADEAHQGVAVDQTHFYAITNKGIGKYNKQSGKQSAAWRAPAGSPLRHLNSGIVLEGKLYCAHSNWPARPTTNSLEMWDAATLKHVGRREFDETGGAITWIDRHDGHWWVVFAHYGRRDSVARTELVRFDDEWKRQAAWTFPPEVVVRFLPYSNSGGSFGPDGLLYVSGHDRSELYALRISATGTVLQLVATLPAPLAGQGFVWDRSDVGLIYGIRRGKKEVVVARLSHRHEYDELRQPVAWQRDANNPILPPTGGDRFDAARCMNPWIVKQDETYRLYYSGGDSSGRQRIGVATASVDDVTAWKRHPPLFDVGEKGAFDARWCVLPHVIAANEGRRFLYYTGNAGRGRGLSSFPGIGLAVSRNGQPWSRLLTAPVLKPSGQPGDADAIGIAGGSVIKVPLADGTIQWRFYYTGCPTVGKPLPLNQQKTICLATSADGIHWKRQGPLMLRDPNRDYENIGVAGPVVLRGDDGAYRMWYSAIGTRWGYYSICYAESDDGLLWRRGEKPGDNLQLTPQGDGWERQMVEYPTIIREGDHLRMFYCGNGYGRTGIGTAVSIAPE